MGTPPASVTTSVTVRVPTTAQVPPAVVASDSVPVVSSWVVPTLTDPASKTAPVGRVRAAVASPSVHVIDSAVGVVPTAPSMTQAAPEAPASTTTAV